MSDRELFDKNVERWSVFYPKYADLVRHLPSTEIDIPLETKEEAEQWFASLDLKNIEVIVVYGTGAGHIYEVAKGWLHQSKTHYLAFVEENLEAIRRLFGTERGTEILNDKQVWLAYLDPNMSVLDSLSEIFVLKPYLVTPSPYYSKTKEERLARLKSKLAFFMSLRAGVSIEYSDYGRSFFLNYFRNILSLPEAYLGTALKGKFKGIPAIICGAGPSLAKNLHVLETLRDRALIFAGGTAMNALNTTGFLPHFGVGIDPNPAQFTRLIMNQAYEVPFLYRSRFLNEALNIIHGDHVYVTGSSGYGIAEWLEKKLNIEQLDVSEGHNVVNFSLSLAHAMGCNPIILVGLDLAYTDNLSYTKGIIHHPLHDRRQDFRTKSANEELLSKEDIFGQPTFTLWKWVSESLWFSTFAQENPSTIVVNCTEGGIGFKGIPNKSLAEVADQLLTNQYDVQGMVSAQLQQCPLPATVTLENIQAALKEMRESLNHCVEYCQTVRLDFENSERILRQENKIPDNIISEKAIKALSDMEEEPAYMHLLKVFSEHYLQLFAREFQRLTFDETLLTEQEISLKRVSLNTARYKFLKDTANVTMRIIDQVMEEDAEKRMVAALKKKGRLAVKPAVVEEQGAEEIYSFENGKLTLRDPTLGISVQESFVPDALVGAIRKTYPSGALEWERYYLEGALHGPTSYFGEDGTLLGRSWFIRGVRQGKVRTYYPQGALRSVESYKEGVCEGKQKYYYPDGTVRSILPYHGGQLEGNVLLYHSNGQLQRELHYVKGKRQGVERCWDEVGLLVIEAQFDQDKPIGTARKWYSNGNIAKEVVYEADGSSCEVREWDTLGRPISREKVTSKDYFDQVAKQTSLLTASLGQMLQQVASVAPMVEGVVDKSVKKDVHDSLQEDVKNVLEQLKQLEEINKKLVYESGLDPANPEEAFWKTPTSQREMEKEIEVMTQAMTGGMANIQNTLVTTLGLLAKKLSQKAEEERKAEQKKSNEEKENEPK